MAHDEEESIQAKIMINGSIIERTNKYFGYEINYAANNVQNYRLSDIYRVHFKDFKHVIHCLNFIR